MIRHELKRADLKKFNVQALHLNLEYISKFNLNVYFRKHGHFCCTNVPQQAHKHHSYASLKICSPTRAATGDSYSLLGHASSFQEEPCAVLQVSPPAIDRIPEKCAFQL